LKDGWQRHVLSSGYLDAALALEQIRPEYRARTEVLGARVVLYNPAKKWEKAAAVASHLVKVEPENEAYPVRRRVCLVSRHRQVPSKR
jgi:lipopolysaccharide biosynthesis regulator YciM